MDLLQLRYFQRVARRQHLTRAAADLLVAQPSLSRTIARLEADLGVPLFERTGRQIHLNRFGELFLAHVDRVLQELEDGVVELAEAAGVQRNSVAVAAETLRPLTDLVARFRAQAPQVTLRLYQATAAAMATQLRDGEIDLALASQPLVGTNLDVLELFNEEVLLAVPLSHPLARRRSKVAIAELLDESFATTRPGQWQRSLLDQLFARTGRTPIIACEADEPPTIRALIAAGVGVGLLPSVSRTTTDDPLVAWLHLDTDTARRTLRLYWRRDAYLSGAARQFRDFTVTSFSPHPEAHPE